MRKIHLQLPYTKTQVLSTYSTVKNTPIYRQRCPLPTITKRTIKITQSPHPYLGSDQPRKQNHVHPPPPHPRPPNHNRRPRPQRQINPMPTPSQYPLSPSPSPGTSAEIPRPHNSHGHADQRLPNQPEHIRRPRDPPSLQRQPMGSPLPDPHRPLAGHYCRCRPLLDLGRGIFRRERRGGTGCGMGVGDGGGVAEAGCCGVS